MKYNLRNGYSVSTRKLPDDATEFRTRNAAGETISTVTLGREAARETLTNLRVVSCLRRSA